MNVLGILITNASLVRLLANMKDRYKTKYLLTYRLNQDVLENFFGVIRSKGGLHDHPDQLQFMHRMRSYILGKNESGLAVNGNTEVDHTPDLNAMAENNVSFDEDFNLEDDLEFEKDDNAELQSLQYDALEHLAGYICHRVKDPEYSESLDEQSKTYTWTDQLSEGFLRKPTEKLMSTLEQMESIFNNFNGNDSLLCVEGYLKKLIEKSDHFDLDIETKKLFFRSRMYFRIKKLNSEIVENAKKKRKLKKLVV